MSKPVIFFFFPFAFFQNIFFLALLVFKCKHTVGKREKINLQSKGITLINLQIPKEGSWMP